MLRTGVAMRGLWDHEQLLSPSLVRSAVALLGGFLAALVAVNVLGGLMALAQGRFVTALSQFTGGIAFPFAVWLGVRMLADLLALQHRTHDKVAGIDSGLEDEPPAAPKPVLRTTAATARASDDGVAYPDE